MKITFKLEPTVSYAQSKEIAIKNATPVHIQCCSSFGWHWKPLTGMNPENITVLRTHKVRKKTIQQKVPNKKKVEVTNPKTGQKFVPKMITESIVMRSKKWVVERFDIPVVIMQKQKLKVEIVNHWQGGEGFTLTKK